MIKRSILLLVLSFVLVFAAGCGENSDKTSVSDKGSSAHTDVQYRVGVTINNRDATFNEYTFNGKEYALSYGTIATMAANRINTTTANPLRVVVSPLEDVSSMVLSSVLTVKSGANFNAIDDSYVETNRSIVTNSEVDGNELKVSLDTLLLEDCKMVVVVVHVYFGDFDDCELYIGISR